MRMICIGDSNTYGYDPRGYWGGRYGPEERWTDLLAKHTGWEVINDGVNGRCIPNGMVTLPPDVRDTDWIAVMLGTNDLLQGRSPQEAAGKMRVFLKLLLPHCSRLLLIAPPPMARGEWVDSEEMVLHSVQLAEEYQRICLELPIVFIDTREWNVELSYDGVHFSEAGHQRFACQLADVISQIQLL